MGTQITLTNDLIRRVLAGQGHHPEPGKLHLVGIRGAVPVSPDGRTLQPVRNTLNGYNDTIACFGTELRGWKGSVDPGTTFTLRPMNPDGCAHLENGKCRFKPGWHLESKYGRTKPCLIQAESFRIWRDRDRDGNRDPHDPLRTGQFGIHLHAGGVLALVGPNSAGCQIFWGGWWGIAYQEFLELCWEPSGTRVTEYYLYDVQHYLNYLAHSPGA